jgi:hypothetical protein
VRDQRHDIIVEAQSLLSGIPTPMLAVRIGSRASLDKHIATVSAPVLAPNAGARTCSLALTAARTHRRPRSDVSCQRDGALRTPIQHLN